jgi:ABC-type arginine/histidine transport system permease subunit
MIELVLSLIIAFLGARSITRLLLHWFDGMTNGAIVTLSTSVPTILVSFLLVYTNGQFQTEHLESAINRMIPWGFAIVAVSFLISAFASLRLLNQASSLKDQQDHQDQLDVFE